MKLFKGSKNKYPGDEWTPVIKTSICTGEAVAGFKNLKTGKFEDIMLVRGDEDLKAFRKSYGIPDGEELPKIY